MADDQFQYQGAAGFGGAYPVHHLSGPRQHASSSTVFDNQMRDFRSEGEYLQQRLNDDNVTNQSESVKHKNKLADLFRPPIDILHTGSFDSARNTAKSQTRWLLVNLQDPKEFASQRLNRDTWKSEMLKDLIGEFFVFVQPQVNTPDGQKFQSFYRVTDAPCIAIIDPRTGEKMKSWIGFRDHDVVHTDLVMFLGENSFGEAETLTEAAAKIEQQRKRAHSLAESANLVAAAAAAPISDNEIGDVEPSGYEGMTEDEQLAAAIAASLDENGTEADSAAPPSASEKPVSDMQTDDANDTSRSAGAAKNGMDQEDDSAPGEAAADEPASKRVRSPAEASPKHTAAPTASSESTSFNAPVLNADAISASDCALRVRWRGAPTVSCGFRQEDSVGDVYAHVASLVGHENFELVTKMPRAVYADRSLTLKEAGLVGRVGLEVEMK